MGQVFTYAPPGNSANVIVGLGSLTIKRPYTASSYSDLGYTIDGVDFLSEFSVDDEVVPWSDFPVDCKVVPGSARVVLAIKMAETTLANFQMAVGISNDDSDLSLNKVLLGRDDMELDRIGAKLIGPAANGKKLQVTVRKGRPIGKIAYRMEKRSILQYAFGIQAYRDYPYEAVKVEFVTP